MDQTINLNQNVAECLRNVSNFGSTTVVNICTGQTSVVPWGSADWAVAVFLTVGGVVFVLFILGLLLFILLEYLS